MFGELSHELKNILHSSASLQNLQADDVALSLAVLPLTDAALREALASALLAPEIPQGYLERLQELPALTAEITRPALSSLKRSLAELALDSTSRLQLWRILPEFSDDELAFFASQLNLFSQYKQSLTTLESSRELTLSVLNYTRADEEFAVLRQVWQQTQILLRSRLRKQSPQWHTELSEEPLAISPSRLTQVLMNLFHNALDAMETLPLSEQWIRLETSSADRTLLIRISNAGNPIEAAFQSKLFQRGASSKGKKGSGIGLFVSRRYLHEVGGELSYDTNAKHPSFLLKIPKLPDIS
jgi:signal transduction histidine kinase